MFPRRPVTQPRPRTGVETWVLWLQSLYAQLQSRTALLTKEPSQSHYE